MPRLERINTATTKSDAAYALRVQEAILAIGHADLTDSDGSQTLDFAAALPDGAQVVGHVIEITEAFADAGAGAFTCDVGIKSGDTDALSDASDLSAIANVFLPVGAAPTGFYGGETPSVVMDADVNVDTAIAGALVVHVLYVDVAGVMS